MRVKRFIPISILLGLFPAVWGQVWEKPIAPGLTYRMEVDTGAPLIVHALRYSPASQDIRAVSETASGTVYAEGQSKGRETISSMVRRTQALGGINADFFPSTGRPLGLTVRDGELISRPFLPRATLGWGEGICEFCVPEFQATMRIDGQETVLNGFNEQCGLNEIVLNTSVAGLALAKAPNLVAVVRLDDTAPWGPNTRREGTFLYLVEDAESVPVQPGNVLIAAQGPKRELIRSLRNGQRVSFEIKTRGFRWEHIRHTVGGGPFLVRGGKVNVTWKEEKFQESLAGRRHPRTAVGLTREGNLWFVAVDGRSALSRGATLTELAGLMLRLGCVEAMNLDGGGSTTLNLFGITLNRPSEGTERLVASGVLFYGAPPLADANPRLLTISGPKALGEKENLQLYVQDEEGRRLPNAEVLWGVKGPAWIDQGGLLRALGPGLIEVQAAVQGIRLTKSMEIAKALPPLQGGR